MNTHLDHGRDYAKIEGAKQIVQRLKDLTVKVKLPTVITGDFNALPDSEPLAVFAGAGYVDLSASSGGTFHATAELRHQAKLTI